MASRGIPEDVRSLLRECVISYEQLEALLFLRSRAEQDWSTEDVATHLRVPPETTAEALDHLRRYGLVHVGLEPNPYRYAPANQSLAAAVEALARVYDTDRAALMNVMNAAAIERLRTKAIQAFADAFIIDRKKDKND